MRVLLMAAAVPESDCSEHRIRRKQVLGGLTPEYYIAALPPSGAKGRHWSRRESYFRAPQVGARSDLGDLAVGHERTRFHAARWQPVDREIREMLLSQPVLVVIVALFPDALEIQAV